jgi:hypothetical protein
MPRFMDFHEDPKLPAEAIAPPALSVPCGDVHRVDGLTSS